MTAAHLSRTTISTWSRPTTVHDQIEEAYEEVELDDVQDSGKSIFAYSSRASRARSSVHTFGSNDLGRDWPLSASQTELRSDALSTSGGGDPVLLEDLATSVTSLFHGMDRRSAFEQPRPPGQELNVNDSTNYDRHERRSFEYLPKTPIGEEEDRKSLNPTSSQDHLGLSSSTSAALPPEETWQPVMALMASLQAFENVEDARPGAPAHTKPLPPLPPIPVAFGRNDPADPHTWSKRMRWWITLLMGVAMMNATFSSTVANGTMVELGPGLQLNREERVLVTSIFVGGCTAGPVVWAPMSEIFGRRYIFLLSTLLYTAMQVGCALAPGKTLLLVFRFLSGAFASSALTNTAGVICDLWEPMDRGMPMIVFAFSPFLGPVLGPLAGAAVITVIGSWRAVFWLLLLLGFLLEVALLLFLPETYAPLILSRIAELKRRRTRNPRWTGPLDRMDKSLKSIVRVNLARPLVMVFTEPVVACATAVSSYLFGLLYIFFVTWPSIFGSAGIYKFGDVSTGLSYLPMGAGCALGAMCIPRFNRLYVDASRKAGHPCPEMRLVSTFPVGPSVALGFLWAGWSSWARVHWIVPMLAGVPIGFGMVLVFQGWLTYLADCYRLYAASAVAGTVIVRSIVGATLPLAGSWLLTALGGVQWLYTLLGGLALLLTPVPFYVVRNGAKLRARSGYAPWT